MLINKISYFIFILIFSSVFTACGNATTGVGGKPGAATIPSVSAPPGSTPPGSAPPVVSNPPGGTSVANYRQSVLDLAGKSACSQYSWQGRGRAPAGYIKGVALAYSRSVCRLKAANPLNFASVIMSTANTRNASVDALAHYESTFASLNIPILNGGVEAVRALYTLGLGLGMRESSGNYCEGWDTSAGSNRPSSAAEAGTFQVSYDSIGASPELQKLYNEYQADTTRCYLNTFKEGASCSNSSILGSGAGADFQRFNKACPAFAAEYAMTLLRVLRSHFGPINRREAEVRTECNSMLNDIQKVIDTNPIAACSELY